MSSSEPLDLNTVEPHELVSLVRKAGGQRNFARQNGVTRWQVQRKLKANAKLIFLHRPAPEARVETVRTGVRRWLLTSAQDSTRLHEGFLDNLEVYRDWLLTEGPCEIMIAGFTYNKSLFEDHAKTGIFWPERVKQYLVSERVRLGDSIDFCGEMNTLPTAISPLTGFETYTRSRWGIFPHAKVQLKSVATMKHEPAKQIMTTGACTMPNYVPKRAGLKASFHHAIGAVLVEIAADGKFFCRHLMADQDGSFYDLDRLVDGEVTEGHRVTAINWGDIHVAQIDPTVAAASFGIYPNPQRLSDGSRTWSPSSRPTILDTLKPSFQFFHDTCDFQARNHHNLKDPHHMFDLYVKGADSVETELREVAMFICETRRDWCQTVVVASNHDGALRKWLKSADLYAYDPPNARFFLECQLAVYKALERQDKTFSIFASVMQEAFSPWHCDFVRFLKEDESFIVHDIECGMHGHLGANGAKASANTFRNMGPKSNTGHVHGPWMLDGGAGAGVCQLDMGYNQGLSNWAPTHIVTLPSGKRQLVTLQDGEWRL